MLKVPEGTKRIKLTNNEILSLYMNLRQNDPTQHGRHTPEFNILQNGFYLNDVIKGRDLPVDTIVRFHEGDHLELMKYVEENPLMKDIVSKMDSASDVIYNEVNKTFFQEMGYELPRMDRYFPVFVGVTPLEARTSKNVIDNLRSAQQRLGANMPLRIGDFQQVFNNHKTASLMYASHALSVDNNRKALNKMRKKYEHMEDMKQYFDGIELYLNMVEDAGTLYASKGEEEFEKGLNTLMNNYSISVLGYNIPLLFKQPIGYISAALEIDSKYLKKAGWGVGSFAGVKPGEIFKSLKWTGVKEGETMLPVEWQFVENQKDIEEILRYSPKLAARTEGMVNRESGETFMGTEAGTDRVRVPLPGGKEIYISKKRAMEGIRVFDTVTMGAIWNAVKEETKDKHPDIKENTDEFFQHVAGRTEEIFDKTQPTYDIMNRSQLSLHTGPLARMLTMFGSARDKIANQFLRKVVKYASNPTKENRKAMLAMMNNVFVMTGLSLAAIDILSGLLRGTVSWDDEEKKKRTVSSAFTDQMITNAFGNFWGLGELARAISSRVDDAPWKSDMEHPFQSLVGTTADAMAALVKGDFDQAFFKTGKVLVNASGVPYSPIQYTKDFYSSFE